MSDRWAAAAAAILGVPAAQLEALYLSEREREAIDATPLRDLALIASVVRRSLALAHDVEVAA